MAISKEKYLNIAIKTFDDAEKYIDIEPAAVVANQASDALATIKKAIVDFAIENDAPIRDLYKAVTSENGSRQNYRMQNTEFAKASFDEYIDKVISIPAAVKDGTISDELTLNSGFFERDRGFIIALFSTEENELVPIPAEDAFEELNFMSTLSKITDEYATQIADKATLVPEKSKEMDGLSARNYDTCIMAVRLMATSMTRFCALLLRHIVNNAAMLYDYAMDDRARWIKKETPAIYWEEEKPSEADESNRWAIFV